MIVVLPLTAGGLCTSELPLASIKPFRNCPMTIALQPFGTVRGERLLFSSEAFWDPVAVRPLLFSVTIGSRFLTTIRALCDGRPAR